MKTEKEIRKMYDKIQDEFCDLEATSRFYGYNTLSYSLKEEYKRLEYEMLILQEILEIDDDEEEEN